MNVTNLKPLIDPALAKARGLIDMTKLAATHKGMAEELLASCQAVIDAEALTLTEMSASQVAEEQTKAERVLAVVKARCEHALENRESDAVIAWRKERPQLIEKAAQRITEILPRVIAAAHALEEAQSTLAAVIDDYRQVTLPAVAATARGARDRQGQPAALFLPTVDAERLEQWIRAYATPSSRARLMTKDLAAFEAFVGEQLMAMGSRFASA